MDCWRGEATVFSCEITGEAPVSLGGPGQTQRGTENRKEWCGKEIGSGVEVWGGAGGIGERVWREEKNAFYTCLKSSKSNFNNK